MTSFHCLPALGDSHLKPDLASGEPGPPVTRCQLYPQAPGSLFVAFYDSQGYSGAIITRLHTWTFFSLSKKLPECDRIICHDQFFTFLSIHHLQYSSHSTPHKSVQLRKANKKTKKQAHKLHDASMHLRYTTRQTYCISQPKACT
jgi:hypothetical protein